jgi:hypothetical protein
MVRTVGAPSSMVTYCDWLPAYWQDEGPLLAGAAEMPSAVGLSARCPGC